MFNPEEDAEDYSVQSVYGIWDWSDMILAETGDIATARQLYLGYFGNDSFPGYSPPIDECKDNALFDLLTDDTVTFSSLSPVDILDDIDDLNIESEDYAGSCVSECTGNDECIQARVAEYIGTLTNCESIRPLSNISTALGDVVR